jgi:hypothetical protein
MRTLHVVLAAAMLLASGASAQEIDRLRFELEHRSRFEHLSPDFRASNPDDATALSLRTLLRAEATLAPIVFGIELEDSRAYASDATPLNTTHVNTLEVLQGYAGIRRADTFGSGDSLSVTLGRFTADVGSRRLVARNRFRNTINAFTGMDARWRSEGGHVLRVLAALPVSRKPSGPEAVADNERELDTESADFFFWGGFYGSPSSASGVRFETYVFGLREQNDGGSGMERRLLTPGLRIVRATAGLVEFELEAMVQVGTSLVIRTPTRDEGGDQFAFAGHASAGYRFDAPWSPRLALHYDYASGDRDASDDENGRFDTLFGASRFELGPTGVYGAVARSNLSSPAVRVEATPSGRVDVMGAYRLVLLASPQDAWTPAGMVDPGGTAGSFVGQQLEARLRVGRLPGRLSLELGGAYLARGSFAEEATGGREGGSAYFYTQITRSIGYP